MSKELNIKFTQFYIDVLESLKKYSTCSRLSVAAILVKDSRILSSGYNGVPSGKCECNKIFRRVGSHIEYHPSDDYSMDPKNSVGVTPLSDQEYREVHHAFADKFEIHAEMNCLGFALRNHTDITGAELFITTSPCMNCCKLILVSGIKAVYYLRDYDDLSGVKFLQENGVECVKLVPNLESVSMSDRV